MVEIVSKFVSTLKLLITILTDSLINLNWFSQSFLGLEHDSIIGDAEMDPKILKKVNKSEQEGINSNATEEVSHFGPLRSSPIQLTWKNVNVLAHGAPGVCGLSKKGEDKTILGRL